MKHFFNDDLIRISIEHADSCLGRYDGQVYEALLERARLNPSNRHKVNNENFRDRK